MAQFMDKIIYFCQITKRLVLLFLISFPCFAEERPNKDTSQIKRYHWIPGIEFNSVQSIAVPQHFLYCIWCKTAAQGYGGTHAMLELSPGLFGGSASLGITHFEGFILTSYTGKLTILRTWETGLNVTEKNTYIGPEFSINLVMIDFEIGVLHNLTQTNDSDDFVLSIGIGMSL